MDKKITKFFAEKVTRIKESIVQYEEGLITGPEMIYFIGGVVDSDSDKVAAIHEYQDIRATLSNKLLDILS